MSGAQPTESEVKDVLKRWRKRTITKKDFIDFVMRFRAPTMAANSTMTVQQLRACAHVTTLLGFMKEGSYICRQPVVAIHDTMEVLSGRHSVEASKRFEEESTEEWEKLGFQITCLSAGVRDFPDLLRVYVRVCNEGASSLKTTMLEKLCSVYPQLAADWERCDDSFDESNEDGEAKLSKLEFLKRGCEALANIGEFDILMQAAREKWGTVKGWQHQISKYGNVKSEGSYASFFKSKIFPLKLKRLRLVHKDCVLTAAMRLALKEPTLPQVTHEELQPLADMFRHKIEATATLEDAAVYREVIKITETARSIILGAPPPTDEELDEIDACKEIDDMVFSGMCPADIGCPDLDSWTLKTPEQLAATKKQRALCDRLAAVIAADDFFQTRKNACTLSVCAATKEHSALLLKIKDGMQVRLEFDEGSKFFPFHSKKASVIKAACTSTEAESLQAELDKQAKTAKQEVTARKELFKKEGKALDVKMNTNSKVDKHFGGDKDDALLEHAKAKLALEKKLNFDIKELQVKYREKVKDLQDKISAAKSAVYCQVKITEFARNLTIPVECAVVDVAHYQAKDISAVGTEATMSGSKTHIVPAQIPCIWTATAGDAKEMKMPKIRMDFKTPSDNDYKLMPRCADFGDWKLQYKIPVEVVAEEEKEADDGDAKDGDAKGKKGAKKIDDKLLVLFDDDLGTATATATSTAGASSSSTGNKRKAGPAAATDGASKKKK
eukprot:g8337.t1